MDEGRDGVVPGVNESGAEKKKVNPRNSQRLKSLINSSLNVAYRLPEVNHPAT